MRPSWHLDLKWLFGLACLISIMVAGSLFSLSKLTEHDSATGIFTGVMATFAKEQGGSAEFDELQAQVAANPDEEFTIEGVTLPVKGSELAGLSYDQAVDLVVGRIADRLYTEGPDSVEQFFTDTPAADPEEGAAPGDEPTTGNDEFSLGPFSFLTQDTHDAVRGIVTYSLIPVLIFALPLVFFSSRFGRLGSIGVVLAIGTAPFALLWLIIKLATEDPGGEGIGSALAESLSPTAGDVSLLFAIFVAVGAGLAAMAVCGHCTTWVVRKLRSSRETQEAEAEPEPELQTEPVPPQAAFDEEPSTTGDGFPSIDPGGLPQA